MTTAGALFISNRDHEDGAKAPECHPSPSPTHAPSTSAILPEATPHFRLQRLLELVTNRHMYRHTDRHTYMHTNRLIDTGTQIDALTRICLHTDSRVRVRIRVRHEGRHTYKYTDRHTDKYTGSHTDIPT